MQDIDFLPDQYRRKQRRRRSKPSHLGLIAVVAVLLASAASFQYYQKREAHRRLAELLPQYELTASRNEQLAELSKRLQTADASAQLLTYLRQPWPRTQLLDALLDPLPEEITFETLQIAGEVPVTPAATRRRSFGEDQKAEADPNALPAAARDLKQLREQFDTTKTVVRISGTTSRSSVVHRYLAELGRAPLFSEVELGQMESSASQPDKQQFDVVLVVRPGYGCPGGPTPTQKESHGGAIE